MAGTSPLELRKTGEEDTHNWSGCPIPAPNPLNQAAESYIYLNFVVGHGGTNPVTVVGDLDVPLNGKMFIMLTS